MNAFMNYRMTMRMTMGMKINEKKIFFDNAMKMSYYQCNRKEILQKAKERYSKRKLLSII